MIIKENVWIKIWSFKVYISPKFRFWYHYHNLYVGEVWKRIPISDFQAFSFHQNWVYDFCLFWFWKVVWCSSKFWIRHVHNICAKWNKVSFFLLFYFYETLLCLLFSLFWFLSQENILQFVTIFVSFLYVFCFQIKWNKNVTPISL